MSYFLASSLTKNERSILLYAETCCVDYGGLLEGVRMNADDIAALERMQEAGVLAFGRIPSKLLGTFHRQVTHWLDLTDDGWSLVHQIRRMRGADKGAARAKVDVVLFAREAA